MEACAGVCIYICFPWYFVPKLMPSYERPIDTVRRGARVISGLFGAALGCYVGYLAAAGAYVSGVKSQTKYEETTSPYPHEVVSADAKVAGGVGATFTFYAVASHITVASIAVGGFLTDCVVGCAENCCLATADLCRRVYNCCRPQKTPPKKPNVDQNGQRV